MDVRVVTANINLLFDALLLMDNRVAMLVCDSSRFDIELVISVVAASTALTSLLLDGLLISVSFLGLLGGLVALLPSSQVGGHDGL